MFSHIQETARRPRAAKREACSWRVGAFLLLKAVHTAGFPDLAERKHVSKLSQHVSKHAQDRR